MSLYRRFRDRREVSRWEAMGRPCPPPHSIKQRLLREFKTRYGLEILVETGTFKGDMIFVVYDLDTDADGIEFVYVRTAYITED